MLRLLFLLPATAVLLLAFRNKMDAFQNEKLDKPYQDKEQKLKITSENINDIVFTDTVPEVKTLNEKGYYIDVKGYYGECIIVIKDKNKKEVKRLKLTEWNEKADYYENLYGEIPPPPPPPPSTEQWVKAAHPNLKSLSVNNNLATVTLKSGKKENYDLNNADQKNAFENKYGKLQPPPPPPPAPGSPIPVLELRQPAPPAAAPVPPIRNNDNITNISNANNSINSISAASPAEHAVVTNTNSITVRLKPEIATTVVSPVKVAVNPVFEIAVSPQSLAPINAIVEPAVNVNAISEVTVDIIITITQNTSPAELDDLVKKMKEKGYELKFTNKNYNNGILKHISGTLKYKDSISTFSVTDFNKLHLAAIVEDGKVYFNVRSDDGKERI